MQTESSYMSVIIAAIGLNVVVLGVVGMLLSNAFKKRRLENVLKNDELSEEWRKNSPLVHSLREVWLGLIVTIAVPIFTHYCLVGSASTVVSVIVGYLSCMLCGMGCFSRQRRDMNTLGAVTEAQVLKRCLACFSVSLVIFLMGVQTLFVSILFFLQKL